MGENQIYRRANSVMFALVSVNFTIGHELQLVTLDNKEVTIDKEKSS